MVCEKTRCLSLDFELSVESQKPSVPFQPRPEGQRFGRSRPTDSKGSSMNRFQIILAACGLATAAWLGGCAPVAGPHAQLAAGLDMPAEPANELPEPVFMGELARQKRVDQNDGFRAVLLWLDGKDDSRNFKDRAVTLADRGLVRADWRLSPTAPMDKATLAYIVYHALGMKGGLNMALFNSRRYALRELVYRGMMASGADYAYVTGSEFVAILGRADDYRAAAEGAKQEQLPELLQE
jgi:hypothetical protein